MGRLYPLADMVGQVSWLQIGLFLSSVVLMMLIICSSKRYCSTTGHMMSTDMDRHVWHTTYLGVRAIRRLRQV